MNVMNVKSLTKGRHKRDITKDPIRSSLDWKLDFLRECAQFLEHWEETKRPDWLVKHSSLYVTLVLHWRIVHRICSIVRYSTTYSWATCRLTQLNDDLVGYDKCRVPTTTYQCGKCWIVIGESELCQLKFSGISLTEIDSAIQSAEYIRQQMTVWLIRWQMHSRLIPFRRRMMPT